MINKLIGFSISNKLVICILVLCLIGWGTHSLKNIPIDAVPDITNNQVQIITKAPTLAAQEVEQFITFPIEIEMSNLPGVLETRSISRFGLSVITIVFKEEVNLYKARQLISEQLQIAKSKIPASFGEPELAPITTGLGEVYQYIVRPKKGFEQKFSSTDLRTINDWIVKRQLAGTPGVIEVSGWGGHLKQYEVALSPEKLKSMNISIKEVFKAIESNNENTGGSYIENRYSTYFIRGEGLVKSLEDIEKIVVKTVGTTPILIRDIAKVQFGAAPRYGALTYNGKGEVVGGQTLMLKGENSYKVVEAIKNRIKTIQKSLPEGIVIEAFMDRSELIGRAIKTVSKNLIEGGLIVIFILVFLLGNFRGGLIVASVIPLAMLFAIGMMNVFGVSANLMSLGAIDFGLIVDGAVIIVEGIVYRIYIQANGQVLTQKEMDRNVLDAASKIRKSASFGEIIILIVYLPILALVGIEGKMFKPMAQAVSFAILGALILSFTYVPMMSALFLNKKIQSKKNYADKLMEKLRRIYRPILNFSLRKKIPIVIASLSTFILSIFSFQNLGGEFIPTLEEGDFALHQILPPGTSLAQSVEISAKLQSLLLNNFPEIEMIVTKMGSSEIPTDPMPIEVGDIMVKMKPKEQWTSASNKEDMFELMEKEMGLIPGVNFEFTQPIQMRFNELMSGVRQDIAIKIYGENTDILFLKAKEAEKIIKDIKGIGDLRVEQVKGLPQMIVKYQRNKLAEYGLNIADLNSLIRMGFAGKKAGVIFEGEKQFDFVVRFEKRFRENINHLKNMYITLPNGGQIPLKEVAEIKFEEGPMQISRENAKRRVVLGINSRNRDTESLVKEIRSKLDKNLNLPVGYHIDYGGQFENLITAKRRLAIAVPIALTLIFVLLFLTFKSVKQAILIFTAIPLASIGGIWSLWIFEMPFSISAGIGFIALFGVAVLNGIVLIAQFNELKEQGIKNVYRRAITGSLTRLRPVVITASVAAFGFVPMALSRSAGAEVQRPLATVVIGGLITATLLTLVVLPVLYCLTESISIKKTKIIGILLLALGIGICNRSISQTSTTDTLELNLERAIELATENHPASKSANLTVDWNIARVSSAFDFGRTNIFFGSEEFDNSSNVGIKSLGIRQNLKIPTTYFKQYKVQKQKVILSDEQSKIILNELRKNVRLAFIELMYQEKLVLLHTELVNEFRNLTKAANSRFETGEGSYVDKISGETKYWEAKSKLLKSQAKKEEAIIGLQKELNTSAPIKITFLDFDDKNHEKINLDSWQNFPEISFLQENINLAKLSHSLEKQNWLPDLSLSYMNQSVNGVSGFYGYQFGFSLPLFTGTQSKVKAKRIETEINHLSYEESKLNIANSIKINWVKLKQLQSELDIYNKHQIPLAKQLIKLAKRGFLEGEFDYLKFTQYINQAIDLREAFLLKENSLNLIVAELLFLSGN